MLHNMFVTYEGGDVRILHEMENIREKSCLLSPKIHELFEQLGNYVTVIILHGQVGDGAW